jgi:hypothetical protein
VLAAVVTAAALTCTRTHEARTHDEAVFGHFASLGAANRYARKVRAVQFRNVDVQAEGCGDWKVYVGGADTVQQRSSFAAEARRAGFTVTFEQTGDPLAPPQGEVYGVFAKTTTLAAANALQWRLARLSFRYTELVRIGSRWAVVMPQVPVKNALSIAKEVATTGYHIQFHHAA